MKVLLDENLDPRLKEFIISQNLELSCLTVKDMGWLGLKNGELLLNADKNNFDVFVSADQRIKYHQNLSKYKIKIVVIRVLKNNFIHQTEKIPELILNLENIENGRLTEKYFEI